MMEWECGDPACEETRNGYVCTRVKGHEGEHRAGESLGKPPCLIWGGSTPEAAERRGDRIESLAWQIWDKLDTSDLTFSDFERAFREVMG